jgi:hypothetical protein
VPVAEPSAQESGLGRRDVLELVDEEVPEPPLLRRGELGVSLECVGAPPDEIVEVHQSLPALLAFVALVHRGDFAGRPRGVTTRTRRRFDESVGRDQAGLCPLDLTRQLTGSHRRGRTTPADEWHEEACLAGQDDRRVATALAGAAAQLGEGDGVDGPGGHTLDPQGPQPRLQLTRRLARERDCQRVPRIERASMSPPSDPPGQNPSLPSSRPRDDRQGQRVRHDRGALTLIQPLEQPRALRRNHRPKVRPR